jgi:hypothetical protein
MYWDVTSVKPELYLTLAVTFSDGLKGRVCFKPSHLTGVFESLKNEEYFNKVFVDHGVVTWPGELARRAGFSPRCDAYRNQKKWMLGIGITQPPSTSRIDFYVFSFRVVKLL